MTEKPEPFVNYPQSVRCAPDPDAPPQNLVFCKLLLQLRDMNLSAIEKQMLTDMADVRNRGINSSILLFPSEPEAKACFNEWRDKYGQTFGVKCYVDNKCRGCRGDGWGCECPPGRWVVEIVLRSCVAASSSTWKSGN